MRVDAYPRGVLLALDTATPFVSVAVYDAASERVLAAGLSPVPMKHGEHLAPLIERCLREAGIERAALTGIAVGVGPGPFTGLRVGLVTARTLAYVLGVPVHGICTLDAIALEAASTGAVTEPFRVATDARRKEVYLADYDADGRRIDGPFVARPAEVATSRPVAGGGPALYPDAFARPVDVTAPDAAWLARAVADDRVAVLEPEPLYLRRPDAVAVAERPAGGAQRGATP